MIIFDLDGTLIDAYRAINASFNYTMRALGLPRQSAAIIRKAVGWGDELLLAPFVKKKDLARALLIYRRHHRRSLPEMARLFPGTRFVLDRLKKRNLKLAVASNRPKEFSRILLLRLRLEKYFDYVLCADELKHGKPHPEMLLKVMKKLAVSRKETLYVGDMTIDAQAGRRAKVKTVIVTGGSSTPSQIKGQRPWRLINKIRGLLKVISGLA